MSFRVQLLACSSGLKFREALPSDATHSDAKIFGDALDAAYRDSHETAGYPKTLALLDKLVVEIGHSPGTGHVPNQVLEWWNKVRHTPPVQRAKWKADGTEAKLAIIRPQLERFLGFGRDASENEIYHSLYHVLEIQGFLKRIVAA